MIMNPQTNISEDTLFFWIGAARQQLGPVPLSRLRDIIRNGTIPVTTNIWCESWPEWRPVLQCAQELALPIYHAGPVRRAPVAMPAVTAAQPAKRSPFRIIACGVGAVLLGFVALIVIGIFAPKEIKDEVADNHRAEDAILAQIKAPSTAKFSDTTRIKNPDGTVTVAGYVDSQNAFGAMLRKRWIVTIKDGAVSSALIIP